MTATDSGGEHRGPTGEPDAAESPDPVGSAEDQAYFRSIEDTFIGLRGAPLLLSPADWRVAQRWRRAGVPLELIETTLAEVFARRKERGARGRIHSLRYCAPAVEAAWEEVQELTAPGERETAAPALDVPARLEALAAALPPRLPGRDRLAEAIRALEGAPEAVEAALSRLDDETLDAAEKRLRAAGRAELEGQVEASLAGVAGRLPRREIEAARERLVRRLLRKRIGLPLLSLFAPEAEAGEGGNP